MVFRLQLAMKEKYLKKKCLKILLNTFFKEWGFDFIKVDFCGYRFKAPANYDHYLKNLYGDYMEIPPLEKRELHVAYKITF